jgi:sulfate transport system permease protein
MSSEKKETQQKSIKQKATTENKKKKQVRVIPGFGLTLGITVTMLSLLVLIPLVSVLMKAFELSPREFWELITAKVVVNAMITSFGCSFIAAIINCVFGLVLAWVLVRYDFPGKRFVDGLIELPFALPTAVAGITLSKMYSDTGMIGKYLAKIGLKVSYTKVGIVVALVFVGIPFVVRAIQPILENLDDEYEEASYILGASKRRTFFKVILPELRPALLTGFGLAFARGVGEYGSVIYISGNSAREHTQVISYVIMQKLNYIDYASATAIALVMLVFSFLILLFINIVQARQAKRTNNI